MINSNVVFEYFNNLQTNIVETLQIVDGKNFINDSWQRKEGGGGTSCLLENGNILIVSIFLISLASFANDDFRCLFYFRIRLSQHFYSFSF